MRLIKFILKEIGEYVFSVIFFMGAFVTIVGTGVIDESAGPAVQYFYWSGVGAFVFSILVLIALFVFRDRDDVE